MLTILLYIDNIFQSYRKMAKYLVTVYQSKHGWTISSISIFQNQELYQRANKGSAVAFSGPVITYQYIQRHKACKIQ